MTGRVQRQNLLGKINVEWLIDYRYICKDIFQFFEYESSSNRWIFRQGCSKSENL